MKIRHLIPVAAASVVLAACDSTTPQLNTLVSDSTLTADIAHSAGDALASVLETMAGNEVALGLPGSSVRSDQPALTSNSLSITRQRTCYDINNAVVANCSPLSVVRKVVTYATIDGNRSGQRTKDNGSTVNWSGAVHRVMNDTITRNFTGDAEVSRTHGNVTIGHDTSSVSDENVTRVVSEATRDSIKAVTWNLPRHANPFPVSGSIVRVDSLHVVATRGSETRERKAVWVIRIDFPADAQGNVALHINDKTCSLNLVTRVVSNCR